MEYIIVTRHSGAVEWLRRRGISGSVMSHIDDPWAMNVAKVEKRDIPLGIDWRTLKMRRPETA